jgi:hypothetical protein
MENDRRIQWQPMVEMLIVLVTILGSTIPLYMHSDAKLDAYHVRSQETIDAIRQDMKEFHTQLALQDQEFKMRLCAIEERNRK